MVTFPMSTTDLAEINKALVHLQDLSDSNLAYIMAVFESALRIEYASDDQEIDLRLNRLRYEIEKHLKETSHR